MIAALSRATRHALIGVIKVYRAAISPLLGNVCRFTPSCSHYAEEALQTLPLWRALPLICWRLLRCQPLCAGGFDPVPAFPGQERHRL